MPEPLGGDDAVDDPACRSGRAVAGNIDHVGPWQQRNGDRLASGIDSVSTSCPLKTGTGQDAATIDPVRLSAVRTSSFDHRPAGGGG